MKFELWQVMVHFTSFAVILCIIFAELIPMDVRIGMIILLIGLLVSLGSWTLPQPALREHVANDRQLRRWGNVLAYGLPASFLVLIGSTVFLGRFGIVIGFGFFFVYCVYQVSEFNRDEGGCS